MCLECKDRSIGVFDSSVTVSYFNMTTLLDETILGLEHLIFLAWIRCESPFVGDNHVLSARELETGTTKSFNGAILF
jgi:hypothetical protein